jgi:hypothetical protein
MASPVVVSRIQNRRGLQSQFDALYPPGYNGIGGYGSIIGFDATNYPDVILPGELAFCTDTRKMFVGNTNAEYVELAAAIIGGLTLEPYVTHLPPVGVFTTIPGLSYTATPFFTLLYDLTDEPTSFDQDVLGTDFTRNGSLQITALVYAATPPQVTSTDTGTEINNAAPSTITFMAEYNVDTVSVDIKYMHDFPGDLTFSSTSIIWQPF